MITETLRLYPTVWILGREAIEPSEVGGYRVPVGTTVYMSQWVVHRDARFYDDAETFRPVAAARGRIVLPVAARVGRARLIDNLQLTVDGAAEARV